MARANGGNGDAARANGASPRVRAPRPLVLSLRAKLLLTILLVTLVPLALLTLVAYSGGRQSLTRQAAARLDETAATAARGLDNLLSGLAADEQRIIANDAVRRLLALPQGERAGSADMAQAQSVLRLKEFEAPPATVVLELLDARGESVMLSTRPTRPRAASMQQVVDNAQRGRQETYWLAQDQLGLVRLNHYLPIIDGNGGFAGALLSSVDKNAFTGTLDTLLRESGEDSFYLLYDGSGQLVASSRRDAPGGGALAEAYIASQDAARNGGGIKATLPLADGDDIVLAARQLDMQPWLAAYGQPHEVVIRPLGELLRFLWQLALVVIVLFTGAAAWLSYAVARPISRLTALASRAAGGDLTERAAVRSRDEIGQLAEAFNDMSDQLQVTVSNLTQRNRELAELNERLKHILSTTGRLGADAGLKHLGAAFLEELALQLKVDGGSLYVVEDGQLRLVHTLDPGHAPATVDYPPPEGSPFAEALAEGKPLLLADFSADRVRSSGFGGYLGSQALVFPLLGQTGEPLALIALHDKQQEGFTQVDREICAIFATFASERLRLAQAREQLAASEDNYRRLVETAQEGILTCDELENITFANSSIAHLLGYRPGELIGMNLLELMDEKSNQLIQRGTASRRQGVSSVYEIAMYDSQRRPHLVQVSASPLFDKRGNYEGALGVLTDITELKQAQQHLAEQSAYLQSVFSALSDQVCVLDPGLHVTAANRRFREAFNLPPGELRFVSYEKLVEPLASAGGADDSPLAWARRTFATGERQQATVRLLKPAGGEALYELDTAPLKGGDGQVTGVVLVLRDVTEQRRLEQQLRQAHKLEAIGRLASGIAHDFNNILTAIGGCKDLALAELADGHPAAEELAEISAATQRGKDIVRQILAFSRRQEQERRTVSLRSIVSEVLSLMRATLPANIEVRQEFAAPRDTVLADAGQLHQVVMNLCTNAGQAMADGGGVLSARVLQVEAGDGLHARHPQLEAGPWTALSISDSGPGIAPGKVERIFEPFFTTKETGQGTGLGLAVVHGIVLNHGGAIEVSSQPGKGTTFTIYLPQAEAPGEEPGQQAQASHGTERVLFVDDETLIVRTTQRLLERLGYQVAGVSDSRQALELFKEAPDNFDIVITDQTMPHMIGSQMAAEMLAVRPGLPVVLCTGFSETVPPEKAREIGIAEYVMKPYGGEELGAIIRRLLDGQG